MRRLVALVALSLVVFCGTTASSPVRTTSVRKPASPAVTTSLHAAATTNWVVVAWSFPDDGKGAIDSAYVQINCCSVIGFTTHQFPGSVTADSFNVGAVTPGTTASWIVQVWGKRSGFLGPKSAPDTVSYTAPGGAPPAPTITSLQVH